MHQADPKFMKIAINEAIDNQKQNSEFHEFPIGALIEKDGKIIAVSGNRYNIDTDPSGHAEIVAIRRACIELQNKHLEGCVLYTTNEPCPMCSTACVVAEIKGIVYGANMEDMRYFWMKERGESESEYKVVDISCEEVVNRSNPKPFLVKDFLRQECLELFKYYQ